MEKILQRHSYQTGKLPPIFLISHTIVIRHILLILSNKSSFPARLPSRKVVSKLCLNNCFGHFLLIPTIVEKRVAELFIKISMRHITFSYV